MQAQASTTDNKKRKEDFDKVQQIVWDQVPFIYLIHKNALSAISPALANATPGVLRPQTYWNVEKMCFAPEKSGGPR